MADGSRFVNVARKNKKTEKSIDKGIISRYNVINR